MVSEKMPYVSEKQRYAMDALCSIANTLFENVRIQTMKKENPHLYSLLEDELPENLIPIIARTYHLLRYSAKTQNQELPLVSEATLETLDTEIIEKKCTEQWEEKLLLENPNLIDFVLKQTDKKNNQEQSKTIVAFMYMYDALKRQKESNSLFSQYLSTP